MNNASAEGDLADRRSNSKHRSTISRCIQGIIRDYKFRAHSVWVIVRRLHTVLNHDCAIVLDAGKIISRGKFDEIVRNF